MFTINFQSREPIYEQLYKNVIRLISLGVLNSNDKLPPVRQLAIELGVNPNTISKAYKNLENDGVIYSTVGRGSFVCPTAKVTAAIQSQAYSLLTTALENAKDVGINKSEAIQVVNKIYSGGEK